MTFEQYLISKKIDPNGFKTGELKTFFQWEQEFLQMSPQSFTSQKLYLINPIRRKYPLPAEQVASQEPPESEAQPSKVKAKPVLKPKPKIG